jgi:uncharacterized protein
MEKIVIIHGTKGSPMGNWFPWLSAELTKRGAEVIIPRMPTPEGQSLDSWLAAFAEQVGAVDRSTTVIGHSVGAVFLLRLLERAIQPIGRCVFVAGFTSAIGIPEYDILNATFVNDNYNWIAIRANAGDILCFSGDDDPYVPMAQGLEVARNLNVIPYIVPKGGHLNTASGFIAFPLLLEKLYDFDKQ